MDRAEAAANRIIDALERSETPRLADLKAAKVCVSCYGFGYYYHCDDLDTEVKCKTCGGDGFAAQYCSDIASVIKART